MEAIPKLFTFESPTLDRVQTMVSLSSVSVVALTLTQNLIGPQLALSLRVAIVALSIISIVSTLVARQLSSSEKDFNNKTMIIALVTTLFGLPYVINLAAKAIFYLDMNLFRARFIPFR